MDHVIRQYRHILGRASYLMSKKRHSSVLQIKRSLSFYSSVGVYSSTAMAISPFLNQLTADILEVTTSGLIMSEGSFLLFSELMISLSSVRKVWIFMVMIRKKYSRRLLQKCPIPDLAPEKRRRNNRR